ncbi:transmembrane protein 69-like [Littorina saxatilis]|uniref:Transmembrane protein 69 n=1 Tax=Littorina saxatilis TaxID=31220 RepID=A0AAN9B9Q8_9CAEN
MTIHIVTRCPLHQSFTSPVLVRTFLRSQGVRFSSWAAISRLLSRTTSAKLSKVSLQPPQPSLVPAHKERLEQSRYITADTNTSAVTLWEDLKQMRFSPLPALGLGFAGLIPFMAPPALMILVHTYYANIALAQTAYGACILSFLGGVRWGFVLPEGSKLKADWFNLGYSVTPSLVAWGALLLPPSLSSIVLMTGIAGSAYFDIAIKGYPPWFKGLRFVLSLGAVLSLWSVFICRFVLSTPADKAALKQIEKSFQDEEEQG